MFQTNVVERLETHFLFNNFFFLKSNFLKDNVENIVEQATDDNVAHAHCILYEYT